MPAPRDGEGKALAVVAATLLDPRSERDSIARMRRGRVRALAGGTFFVSVLLSAGAAAPGKGAVVRVRAPAGERSA